VDRELDISFRRRRTTRRVLAVAATLIAAGGLYALGSHWLRPSVHRSRVRSGTVERGDLEATLTASGTVMPAAERVLASPVETRIERVLRRAGQVLEEGDAILELDTSATRLQLERLGEKLAQNENDRVQQRLELDDRIAGIESRLETQRLDLEIAQYRLEQSRRLDVDGLISEETLKQSEVELKKATIQLQRLGQEVAAARRSHDAKVERLALEGGILQKEIDDTRRQLDLATTRAPIAGVLTWVADEEGSAVVRGAVLARIADLGSFRVEATVSDAYAGRLKLGQTVRVLVDDVSMPAKLTRVLPTVESGAVQFEVELDDPSHPALRHNLRVDVLVATDSRAGVLKARRGPWVGTGGDRHQVFVVRGDRAVRTDVRLGMIGHEFYEVVEGLEEGDEIILSDMRDYLHARELRLK
jgi:HlyD family secretion protein